jgi:hypothetical protein
MFGFKKPPQPKLGGQYGADLIHWPFTRNGKTEYTDCKRCAESLDDTGRYGSRRPDVSGVLVPSIDP